MYKHLNSNEENGTQNGEAIQTQHTVLNKVTHQPEIHAVKTRGRDPLITANLMVQQVRSLAKSGQNSF